MALTHFEPDARHELALAPAHARQPNRGPDKLKLASDKVREAVQEISAAGVVLARSFARLSEGQQELRDEHGVSVDAEFAPHVMAALREWRRSDDAPVDVRDPLASIPEFLRA